MHRLIGHARKIFVLAIGIPVLILGVILIPLPGPGIVVCFIALLILSLEFDWAARYRDRSKDELKKVIDKAKEQQKSKK